MAIHNILKAEGRFSRTHRLPYSVIFVVNLTQVPTPANAP
jgi:hypothetical protein